MVTESSFCPLVVGRFADLEYNLQLHEHETSIFLAVSSIPPCVYRAAGLHLCTVMSYGFNEDRKVET